ncbi:MAG TPA: heavy metal translocating P-type ATPase metal-binding domain-containing protein [Chitinophagaceae bacterium]|nr:heavy metal translocating P-type ATPase metal-binding domain-containing protein [Chitinophagaceae bacterium]
MKTQCFHCGTSCDHSIGADGRYFCCDGCRFVYQLLQENGLCNYYDLTQTPGIRVMGRFASEKFAYLDHPEIQQQLIRFTDGRQTQVSFYLPQMHCASCIWLLENLRSLQPGILHSTTHFQRKELFVVFDPGQTTLRKVVELLAFVGYEPYISLDNAGARRERKVNRRQLIRIGVAGFCFSNIMMLSFPEYFSSGSMDLPYLRHLFSYLNLALALPVFFYSAAGFFESAWKGLRQRWLNIDAPIALAILVTFTRSVYEILSGAGPGYLDSMSGIVLFMLAGRWFQDKTYDSFSFDRDYKAYFPLGVTVITSAGEQVATINSLAKGDQVLVRSREMVPADGILQSPEARVDYSFVSGENTPVIRRRGELIYAGANLLSGAVTLEVVRPVSQSYITQLWNQADPRGDRKNTEKSFIHPWSRYFTLVLLGIALLAALYWWVADPTQILPAVTSSLIVACPCSLLLSATFTYGNMLRQFGRGHLYLKNASVIESLSRVNTIVFDKTGTLTHATQADISFEGRPLEPGEARAIAALAAQSVHPMSRLLRDWLLAQHGTGNYSVSDFTEYPGHGTEARIDGRFIRLGSRAFVTGGDSGPQGSGTGQVLVSLDGALRGAFRVGNRYRDGVPEMAAGLLAGGYRLHVLSGDHDAEQDRLRKMFGPQTILRFNQSPHDKRAYIERLRDDDPSAVVLMLGDGLNDAGALLCSDAGIAVSEHVSQFTPASDAILDSDSLTAVDRFLAYARSGKRVVTQSFVLSILYNLVGLSFAVRAALSPLVAAILMPVSSVSIVLFVTAATSLAARRRNVPRRDDAHTTL